MSNNKNMPAIRSSAAEYLTFVAANGQGGVEAIYADEDVWLSQKMMGVLYDVETHTINYHLKKIFLDSELQEDSVIRNFRITAKDGKNYNTSHYNLLLQLIEKFCKMLARSVLKSPKPMRKVNLKSTVLCRIGYMNLILTRPSKP